VLLAYLLSPLVDFVNRFTPPRMSRSWTLAAVYLALLSILTGLGAWIGSLLAQEASELASNLPKILGDPDRLRQFPLPPWLEPYRESATEAFFGRIKEGLTHLMPMLTSAGLGIVAMIGNLLHVVLVPILSFFFLKDGSMIHETVLAQFEEPRRRTVEDVLSDVHVLLAQFMRALVLLSLATFVSYWMALAILGVKYSLLLALFAALLEFIPVAGPLIAAISIFVVATLSGSGSLIAIAAFLILYRLFQDYVLQPHLMSSGMEMPPMAVIFAVLAGEQVAGLAGMFLSIPALAILRIFYVRIRKARPTAVPA
jgi:predicted PurR-regulated permease PerM